MFNPPFLTLFDLHPDFPLLSIYLYVVSTPHVCPVVKAKWLSPQGVIVSMLKGFGGVKASEG